MKTVGSEWVLDFDVAATQVVREKSEFQGVSWFDDGFKDVEIPMLVSGVVEIKDVGFDFFLNSADI